MAWEAGNNREPVEYIVAVSTAASAPPAKESPPLPPPGGLVSFAGLLQNTGYFFTGWARNPDSLRASLVSQLGSAVTLAAPPVAEGFAPVEESSVTARWSANGNPADTEYLAELSTSVSREPPIGSSGWVRASSFLFQGLPHTTTYHGRVKARNRAGAETAFVDLGAVTTLTGDTLPPRTTAPTVVPPWLALEPTARTTSAADPAFVLRSFYVFPDPAVGGASPIFHVAVGLADKVTIRAFDVAGRQLHMAALERPAVIDDGAGPQYAYEHAWRGWIASGVYYYTVEAEKGGRPALHGRGRFAVIR